MTDLPPEDGAAAEVRAAAAEVRAVAATAAEDLKALAAAVAEGLVNDLTPLVDEVKKARKAISAEVATERTVRRVTVLVAAIAYIALGGLVVHEVMDRRADDRRTCEQRNEGRARDALLIETGTPDGVGIDFARVPGFDALSPAEQAYWQNLSKALAAPNPDGARERLRALLPGLQPRRC